MTRHQTDPPATPHRIILPSLGSERSRAASGASKFYSNHKWNICKSSAGVWNTSSTTSETSFRSVFGPSDSPGFVQPAPGVAHRLILETRKFQSGSFTVSTCALSENLDEFHLRTLRFGLFKKMHSGVSDAQELPFSRRAMHSGYEAFSFRKQAVALLAPRLHAAVKSLLLYANQEEELFIWTLWTLQLHLERHVGSGSVVQSRAASRCSRGRWRFCLVSADCWEASQFFCETMNF